MTRVSGWSGTHVNNSRPYVTISADAYVAIQGETTILGCGECRRVINFNEYMTGLSVDTSTDNPPGNASINFTVPDTAINDWYAEDNLVLLPMMEVEIYAKGYFLIGGVPQYYKIFWGLITNISKSWSNGVTTVSLSCRDILYWWEKTSTTINPAFLDPVGNSTGGNFVLWGNNFAGAHPFAVIIALARESMGDWSFTAGSLNENFIPEQGAEREYNNDMIGGIMLYWQAKFANMWSSLVIYGTTGAVYPTWGDGLAVSNPLKLAAAIFEQEANLRGSDETNTVIKYDPSEIAAYKKDIGKVAQFGFFQPEIQTKLSIAKQAAEQIGYEFYCDTTGDIICKPPFFNLNVLPNKPVSWIQDIDLIDEQFQDSEGEIITHIVASGHAFGGVTDWGINDEFTTPRTGAFDYHLLRKYGYRRHDFQVEWAGSMRRMYYYILDFMDRLNARRMNGSVTIPMRPELRMGFPVYIPRHDAFYYINAIQHSFSIGSQATTTLTLMAKRSKFLAPKNIGKIERFGQATASVSAQNSAPVQDPLNTPANQQRKQNAITYKISFPDVGGNTGASTDGAKPIIMRHPKTGKLLGYPRVVMVLRRTYNNQELLDLLTKTPGNKKQQQNKKGKGKNAKPTTGLSGSIYQSSRDQAWQLLNDKDKTDLISRIKQNRYETSAANEGAFDYAEDVDGQFKEFQLIKITSITWSDTLSGGQKEQFSASNDQASKVKYQGEEKKIEGEIKTIQKEIDKLNITLTKKINEKIKELAVVAKESGIPNAGVTIKKKTKPNGTISWEIVIIPSVSSLEIRDLGAKTPVNLDEEKVKAFEDSVKKNSAFSELGTEINDTGKQINDLILKKKELELDKNKYKFAAGRVLNDPSVLVRPVSDEFGYEVVGHFRYGRGAYMDRGRVTFASDASANQINIQFAATGSLLTESVSVPQQSTVDFSKAFEKMRPDDWATAASSRSGGTDTPSDFLMTSENTYVADINQNIGKSVFIEVDSIRKSRLLSDLKPSVDLENFSTAFDNCACGVGRTNWISVLPSNIIRDVLRSSGSLPVQFVEAGRNVSSALGVTKEEKIEVISGEVSMGNFWVALNKYLSEKFNREIDSNVRRERIYSGESQTRVSENYADFAGNRNLFDLPGGGSLFDRAANGDQDAIGALQNEANQLFGLNSQGISNVSSNFNQLGDEISSYYNKNKDRVEAAVGATADYYKNIGKAYGLEGTLEEQLAIQNYWENLEQGFGASSVPSYPPGTPPQFASILNPGQYASGSVRPDNVALKGPPPNT